MLLVHAELRAGREASAARQHCSCSPVEQDGRLPARSAVRLGQHRITESQNHRITEWWGLEGTSVGHPVQPPAEAGPPTAGCTGPCPGGS